MPLTDAGGQGPQAVSIGASASAATWPPRERKRCVDTHRAATDWL